MREEKERKLNVKKTGQLSEPTGRLSQGDKSQSDLDLSKKQQSPAKEKDIRKQASTDNQENAPDNQQGQQDAEQNPGVPNPPQSPRNAEQILKPRKGESKEDYEKRLMEAIKNGQARPSQSVGQQEGQEPSNEEQNPDEEKNKEQEEQTQDKEKKKEKGETEDEAENAEEDAQAENEDQENEDAEAEEEQFDEEMMNADPEEVSEEQSNEVPCAECKEVKPVRYNWGKKQFCSKECAEKYKKKISKQAKGVAAENEKKQAENEVKKKLIARLWPYAIYGIIILLIIGAIYAVLTDKRITGSSIPQILSKSDPKDQRTVKEFMAAAGEQGAQREIVADDASSAKADLDKVKNALPEKGNDEAKKVAADAAQMIDDISTLKNDSTSNNGTPDASSGAVVPKIQEAIAQLEKLKALIPDQVTAIDKIIKKLNNIGSLLNYYLEKHLVVNPKDIDYVRNFQVDRRVAEMLVYLVKPKDKSGAGYERITVKRIKFNYDTDRKAFSQESENQEEPLVSSHYRGQAVDISEIDYIKCTQIKRRRLLSDKKKKLAPVPIKVAWQTSSGYAAAGGPEAFGQNMHDVFTNLGTGAISDMLAEQIAEALDIEIDPAQIKGRNLGEIVKYIGIAMLKSKLGIPGDYELGNNLEEVASNVGRAYIADALGVPYESIQGDGQQEIVANIGRGIVENKLGMPAGSLAGKTSEDIFKTAGARYMETSLSLSRGTLLTPFGSGQEFKQRLGQGRIEASLSLKPQTFYGGSVEEVKKRSSVDSFETTFMNPGMIDQWLGIESGMTQKLVDGSISPDYYNTAVGEKVFKQELSVYENPEKRADAYGVTTSDLESLTNGNKDALKQIGRHAVAKALTASNEEKNKLISWFNGQPKAGDLDTLDIETNLGLKLGDLERIFIKDMGLMVFERVGRAEVIKKLENAAQISENEIVREIKFYVDRLTIIQDGMRDLENDVDDAEIRQKARETRDLASSLSSGGDKEKIKKSMTAIGENIRFIMDKGKDRYPKVVDKIDKIKKAFNEIIEGRELNDFDSYSKGSNNLPGKVDPQTKLTRKDIINILMGKKSLKDTALDVGFRKWENELDLPDGSLSSSMAELKKAGLGFSSESILIAVGLARTKEYDSIDSRSASQVDKDLNLPKGTTQDYRDKKMTRWAYLKKAGMIVIDGVIASVINGQFGLDDPHYSLQAKDISDMLSGGWLFVAVKLGGKAIDEALGFPAGGTRIVLEMADKPGDILPMIGAMELGLLAGLHRPVSLEGDIPYNLGLAKAEETYGLKIGALSDGNLAEQTRNQLGRMGSTNDDDKMSRLDVEFGLKAGSTKKMVDGQMPAHEYLTNVGNYLRDSYVYDLLAGFIPDLKNKELKDIIMAFVEKTGTPEEIFASAGAKIIGDMLGLDYPVSIKGNFQENLGAATVEDRLGLKQGSFKGSLQNVIDANGKDRFEAAFYIEKGHLNDAIGNPGAYWTDETKKKVGRVDMILNIPDGDTYKLLTFQMEPATYAKHAGTSVAANLTAAKLVNFLGMSDEFGVAMQLVVDAIVRDQSINNHQTQTALFEALQSLTGKNLDNLCGFDKGTWEKILFVDPADRDHTGPAHAYSTILEQGKKWTAKWLNLEENYETYFDKVFEKYLTPDKYAETQKEMTDAIKNANGIPEEKDAGKFLNGDFKGAAYSLLAAQLVEQYNKTFPDQADHLDYNKVREAFVHDPSGEKAIGDAAVESFKKQTCDEAAKNFSLTEEQKNDCMKEAIPTESEENIRQAAVRNYRDEQKRNAQYATVDMALHAVDKNIPAGFTKAMKEGSSEAKWNMGLHYIGNMVHAKNSDIPADLLPELERYFTPGSPQYHDPKALSNSSYLFLDNKMKEIFGDFVQAGTAKALMEFGQTGKLGSIADKDSLVGIYANYGIGIICNWADKQFGLPIGSTLKLYDFYTKYQDAQKALTAARQWKEFLDWAKSVPALSGFVSEQAVAQAQEAVAAKESALASIKASAITFVITTVFQKQLAAMDSKLGLVPGSSAMMVGMTVSWLITGAVDPITLGIFLALNLLGVYRVDVICTACGYYPDGGDAGAGWYSGGIAGKLLFPDKDSTTDDQKCPLGEFDGTDEEEYKANAIKAAQYKVNRLIGHVLNLPKKFKDEAMSPAQIMTKRQDDVDSYKSQLNDLYGQEYLRGNAGMWANNLTWEWVHIGF